jgi:uridine phosphorylase
MSSPLISPVRLKQEPPVPDNGILLIDPLSAKFAFQFNKQNKGQQQFLFNSNLFQVSSSSSSNGAFFLAGPAVGAPMAVMTLEKLIALGCKRLIISGCCGSISDNLKIGDVFIPTWAKSEEGTSGHYPHTDPPSATESLQRKIKSDLLDLGINSISGPIWTTDAPFRETSDKVKQYSSESIMAVDMEFSALCAVAEYRKVEVAAVFVVSDELSSLKWKPGFKNKLFKKQHKVIFQHLVSILKKI